MAINGNGANTRAPIRIMTRDFELIGEITEYSSLQITRSWHGIGVLELRVNRYVKHADKLSRGCILFPDNRTDTAFVIRHKEIELDENGKASENWIIRAPSLKEWLSDRITKPPQGMSYDSLKDAAGSVMAHYVNNNVVNPADIGDEISDVIIGGSTNIGDIIDWQSRYKVLSEELESIGLVTGIGWNIGVDYDVKKYVFEVMAGVDRTAGQADVPSAIFSTEFGTLKYLSYTESELNYKNYAVVAGQGEGAERRIVEVGDAMGDDRRVLFVDARDVAEETDGEDPQPIPVEEIEEKLRNRGLQKLAEHNQEVYLEGQALSKSRLTYGLDYDLGDVVTLRSQDWGVTMDARITEVKEIYEVGRPFEIELTFGNDRPDVFSKIRQEILGIKSEIMQ